MTGWREGWSTAGVSTAPRLRPLKPLVSCGARSGLSLTGRIGFQGFGPGLLGSSISISTVAIQLQIKSIAALPSGLDSWCTNSKTRYLSFDNHQPATQNIDHHRYQDLLPWFLPSVTSLPHWRLRTHTQSTVGLSCQLCLVVISVDPSQSGPAHLGSAPPPCASVIRHHCTSVCGSPATILRSGSQDGPELI